MSPLGKGKKYGSYIIILVVAAFVIFPRKFSETIGNFLEGFSISGEGDNYDKQIKALENDATVMASVTSKIRTYADTIHNAMYGFGTKEQEIFDVFDKLGTAWDVKALYVAYGKRFTSSSWKNLGFGKYDLVQSLKIDLSPSEYAKIKDKLKLGGFE